MPTMSHHDTPNNLSVIVHRLPCSGSSTWDGILQAIGRMHALTIISDTANLTGTQPRRFLRPQSSTSTAKSW